MWNICKKRYKNNFKFNQQSLYKNFIKKYKIFKSNILLYHNNISVNNVNSKIKWKHNLIETLYY